MTPTQTAARTAGHTPAQREGVSKPTPEPWQVNGVRGKIVAGKRTYVYHGIGPDGIEVAAVWFDERTGLGFKDAHAIVRAVNARDDLVAALQKLTDAIVADCGDPDTDGVDTFDGETVIDNGTVGWNQKGELAVTFAMIREARAAIAKASQS